MRYVRLVAAPAELAEAVDVDALVSRVCQAMDLTPEDTATALERLTRQPVTLEVRPGADIDTALLQIHGGFCDTRHGGVTLSSTRVWLLRLDWPGLCAHELAHVIRLRLGHPADEGEARRVADTV